VRLRELPPFPELGREIGLGASRRIVVSSGPIESRFPRHDLHSGRALRDRAGEVAGT